jgi:hypothetical protein
VVLFHGPPPGADGSPRGQGPANAPPAYPSSVLGRRRVPPSIGHRRRLAMAASGREKFAARI